MKLNERSILSVADVRKKHPDKHIRPLVFDNKLNAFRDANKRELKQRIYCLASNVYEGKKTVLVVLFRDAPISAKNLDER